MKRIALYLVVSLFFAFQAGAQNLDEILKNYFEANGQAKLLEVKTMVMKGKSMQMGMETPFTQTMKRPGKSYLEVPIQGMMMKQGFDGEKAWMTAPWTGSTDPMELSGIQVKSMKLQSDIDGQLYNWKEKGYQAVLEGTEDMEGIKVYKIKLTDSDGDVYVNYMDAENWIILKTKSTIQNQGSTIEAETFYSNYKEIDGIIMPFAIESKMNGQTVSTIMVEEIVFNVDVDDSIFAMPPKGAGE